MLKLLSTIAPYGELKNTPKTPYFKFNIGNWLLNFIVTNAYWLCLFIGLAGLLAYITGFKKGGKVSVFCIIIYWVVAAVCSVK